MHKFNVLLNDFMQLFSEYFIIKINNKLIILIARRYIFILDKF